MAVYTLLISPKVFIQHAMGAPVDFIDQFLLFMRVASADTQFDLKEIFTILAELSQQDTASLGFLRLCENGSEILRPCQLRLEKINFERETITLKEADSLLKGGKSLRDPVKYQALLATMSPLKHSLFAQAGKLDPEAMSTLTQLINIGDEAMAKELFMSHIFGDHKSNEASFVCLAFYLGYCSSEERIQYSAKVHTKKVDLKEKDFFLPLTDDWFVRPLLHLDQLDTQRRQTLIGAMLRFHTHSVWDLRVTKSDLVCVLMHLAC